MADACPQCHGSRETWDGGRRWTCRPCTGSRQPLPARVRHVWFVDRGDWLDYLERELERRAGR